MTGIRYHKGDSCPIEVRRWQLVTRECKAMKLAGVPCRCYAVKGQTFCKAHLMQGYGLFTLAVMAQVGAAIVK